MSSEAATSGKDLPRNEKNKNPSPAAEAASTSSLPHDLLLNCLARVSRLYHPTLYFVSKEFRSIVKSQELYNIRSLLNRKEKCLYICLRVGCYPERKWFTLAKKSIGYRLEHFRPLQGLLPCQSTGHLIAVGSNIYKIGGGYSRYSYLEGPFSSFVSVLDCRSHTWHAAPNMGVERSSYSTASVVDGKIYVAGGCEVPISSLNWVEVFDPETQSWSSLMTSPNIEGSIGKLRSLGLDGKFYLFWDNECVVYDPKEGRWNPSGIQFSVESSYDVIDKVLFCWDHREGEFQWYDTKVSSWKKVNGLEGIHHSIGHDFKMVDLGGKMAVLWDQFVSWNCDYRLGDEIWVRCCVIAFDRRYGDDGDEMWGNVEWSDVLRIIDASCSLSDDGVVLSVTL